MKRVLCVLILLVAFVPGIFAMERDTSREPQIVPYFIGLGFALKGPEEVATKEGAEQQLPFVPCELNIQMVLPPKVQANNNPGVFGRQAPSGNAQQEQKTFRGVFKFGNRAIPLKVIQSELTKFEADLVKVSAGGADQAPNMVPVGHISFRMMGTDRRFVVAVGKLMVQSEEMDQNAEMTLLMHDVTALHVQATKKAADSESPDKGADSENP